jgi:hypothetical protein
MYNLENLYIQIYRQWYQLNTEQEVNEPIPLYEQAQLPQGTKNITRADTIRASKPHMQKTGKAHKLLIRRFYSSYPNICILYSVYLYISGYTQTHTRMRYCTLIGSN